MSTLSRSGRPVSSGHRPRSRSTISDPFLFHKTTNRTTYDVRRVRHASADDVILVNDRGEVTESTIANLLVRHRRHSGSRRRCSSGCLPGVARAQLVEAGIRGGAGDHCR